MAKRKRTIRVPAKDYQPTKAELEDPIRINRQGVPLDKAVKRLLQPVEVREISAEEYRAQRKGKGKVE